MTMPPTLEPEAGIAVSKANREAAKYRLRLREAEAERDLAKWQIKTSARAFLEMVAAERLQDPADLWRFGLSADDVLDEYGVIDPRQIVDAIESLLSARPYLARSGGERISKDDAPVALYRHWDRYGTLLYVGIASSPTRRVAEHAAKSRWVPFAHHMRADWLPSRAAALEAERQAIQEERPVFNIRHADADQPERERIYVEKHALAARPPAVIRIGA